MRLATTTWGDGPRTALLVHGLFSDSSCWYRLGPALAADGFTVVAADLRGHGASPRGRYSATDWSLDLVDTFLGRTFDLAVGHSLGGLALAVADVALRPGATVYLDPAWQMSAEQDVAFRSEWSSWLSWTDRQQLVDALGSGWPAEDVDRRWDSLWRTDPAVVPGLAQGAGYDHTPESADRRALVLAADPSTYVPQDQAELLRSRGLEVEVVAGSGHSWFREDFPAFWQRLRDWLPTTD